MSAWRFERGGTCLTAVELEYLAALWPTSIQDDRLTRIFGHGRATLRRIAADHLGLPSRTLARAQASERYAAMVEADLARRKVIPFRRANAYAERVAAE